MTVMVTALECEALSAPVGQSAMAPNGMNSLPGKQHLAEIAREPGRLAAEEAQVGVEHITLSYGNSDHRPEISPRRSRRGVRKGE